MRNGVNVDKIQKTCLEFADYLQQIKSIFNSIDIEMSNINSNVSADCKEDIQKFYSSIEKNYSVIESNIPTFIEDFRKVTKSNEELDIELSERIVSNIDRLDERREY